MNSNYLRLTGRPCYDIYETKKGHISVGCLEPHFWKSFVKILDLKELTSLDNAFATGIKGKEVKSKIEKVLKTKTASEWEEIFIHPSIVLPIIRLRMAEELENDEIFKNRKMIQKLKSNSQEYTVIKPSLDYQNFLIKQKNDCAPEIGQDNEQIKSKL